MVVNGDVLDPRQPFRTVPYAFEVSARTCTIVTEEMQVANGASFDVAAICSNATTDTLHGGGYRWTGPETNVWVREAGGTQFTNAYSVAGKNLSGQTATVTAFARCCSLPE